jgi:hypothetical protein
MFTDENIVYNVRERHKILLQHVLIAMEQLISAACRVKDKARAEQKCAENSIA